MVLSDDHGYTDLGNAVDKNVDATLGSHGERGRAVYVWVHHCATMRAISSRTFERKRSEYVWAIQERCQRWIRSGYLAAPLRGDDDCRARAPARLCNGHVGQMALGVQQRLQNQPWGQRVRRVLLGHDGPFLHER